MLDNGLGPGWIFFYLGSHLVNNIFPLPPSKAALSYTKLAMCNKLFGALCLLTIFVFEARV
jgi:hypothetical protein